MRRTLVTQCDGVSVFDIVLRPPDASNRPTPRIDRRRVPHENHNITTDISTDDGGALFYALPEQADGLIGLPRLMEMSLHRMDLQPVAARLIGRLEQRPNDANAMLDLSCVLHLTGNRDLALRTQEAALAISRLYRLPSAGAEIIRVLVLMTPGDLADNMPIEFLLQGSDIGLEMLYLAPGAALPGVLPDHDVACIGVCESDATRPLLRMLADAASRLPRPTLNPASRILALARDSLAVLLAGAPGCTILPSVRLSRHDLEQLVGGTAGLDTLLTGDSGYPVICRPVGSHAGRGLARIADNQAMGRHLEAEVSDDFIVSPFFDYRSADSLYRKYRIAFMAGCAYPVHMAVSQRWMVHYLNADMIERADHRQEEEGFFETFDEDFATRHAIALAAVNERIGLDCFSIDCAEAPNGELLVFEADNGNLVHAMDPVTQFGYKRPHMVRLFAAFRAMLIAAAARPTVSSAKAGRVDEPPAD